MTSGINSSDYNIQNLITAYRSGSVNSGSNSNKLDGSVQNAEISRNNSFTQVLNTKLEGLRFSAHAQTRIQSRKIDMTPQILNKLEKAVSEAAGKGGKESLVLMDNMAFIVNIPNRTVITAMDGDNLRESVFTNIDSAVIAK